MTRAVEQQIRSKPLPFDIAKLNRLRQAPGAFARDGFARITSAQNFRRVEKRHTLRETAEQKRSVHLPAAFDQQARHVFRAQFF